MSAPNLPIDLSPEAQEDLENIRLYTLLEWGAEQEALYNAALLEALAVIGDHPTIGRRRDELGPAIRSYVVREHIIYYQVGATLIQVVRIRHGRSDPRRALRG